MIDLTFMRSRTTKLSDDEGVIADPATKVFKLVLLAKSILHDTVVAAKVAIKHAVQVGTWIVPILLTKFVTA